MKKPNHFKEPPAYEIIQGAYQGNPEALAAILQHYDGYINKLCFRTFYDKEGYSHNRIDTELKKMLQNKLIFVILMKR